MKIYQEDTIPLIPLIQDASHRYITILLQPYNTGEKRNWRCCNCGNIIFQYEMSEGIAVDADLTPEDSHLLTLKCKRCKMFHKVLW